MSNLFQKQCYTVSEKVSLWSLAFRYLRVWYRDGNGGRELSPKVGCIAAHTHRTSVLSSPCPDDIRHGETVRKSPFLFRNGKRATGISKDLSTLELRNDTWIWGTILNQREIYAVPPPQPTSVYVSLICFPIPDVVLKPGRHGSAGKGTFPNVPLDEVLTLCSFSEGSSNLSPHHRQGPHPLGLSVTYMPPSSILT